MSAQRDKKSSGANLVSQILDSSTVEYELGMKGTGVRRVWQKMRNNWVGAMNGAADVLMRMAPSQLCCL